MTDSYRTLSGPCGPHEIKEHGSRFIAFAAPVSTEEDAERFVSELRKRFHDASHIAWAYRAGDGEERVQRHSDGGEPSGTAGAPIYRELVHASLFNVVCAVVRYFGGVKLGTGGLSRAFGGAARALLFSAPVTQVSVTKVFLLEVPFDCVGIAIRLTKQYKGGTILSQEYSSDAVRISVAIPKSQATMFVAEVTEKSNGRISVFPQ